MRNGGSSFLDFIATQRSLTRSILLIASTSFSVMRPNEIVNRTSVALTQVQVLLDDIEMYLNGSYTETTTPATTPSAAATNSTQPPTTGKPTTPGASTNSSTSSKPTTGAATTSQLTTKAPPQATTPTTGSTPTTNATEDSSNSNSTTGANSRQDTSKSTTPGPTTPGPTTPSPPVTTMATSSSSETPSGNSTTNYTMLDLSYTLQSIFVISENVMKNNLSEVMVYEVERNRYKLFEINASIESIASARMSTSEIMFWIKYSRLSTQHSLQKLDERNAVFPLLTKLDDIAILVTAAFCILAFIVICYLCYISAKIRRPYIVNYTEYDGSPPLEFPRMRHNPSRNPSSNSNQPIRSDSGAYSSPARNVVTTRSNPLYSSHRSVDVERPVSDNSSSNYNTHDQYPESNNRTDPIAEKNERNTNMSRERPVASSQPRRKDSDYKDPRRNKRSNVDTGKDNDGYIQDEVVGVRPNSESVL